MREYLYSLKKPSQAHQMKYCLFVRLRCGMNNEVMRSLIHTSSAERYAASLAAKGLDPFDRPMHAIANQRMNVSVGDPEVRALLIETGEAFGGYPLGGSPTAFRLTPGAYVRSRWPCTRRGRGAETTGGAIVWAAGRCRRRCTVVRLAPPREEEGRRWNQSRRQRSARERMRKNMSRNTKT
jgi:hypothetical protein